MDTQSRVKSGNASPFLDLAHLVFGRTTHDQHALRQCCKTGRQTFDEAFEDLVVKPERTDADAVYMALSGMVARGCRPKSLVVQRFPPGSTRTDELQLLPTTCSLAALAACRHARTLTSVGLSHVRLDADLAYALGVAAPELRELTVAADEGPWLNEGLPALLPCSPHLRCLSLDTEEPIPAAAWSALESCTQLQELELTLGYNAAVPARLSALTQLRSLGLSYVVPDQDASPIAQLSALTGLSSLSVKASSPMPPEDMGEAWQQRAPHLASLSGLRRLCLDGIDLEGVDLARLSGVTYLELGAAVSGWPEAPAAAGPAAGAAAGAPAAAGAAAAGAGVAAGNGAAPAAGLAAPAPASQRIRLPPGLRELVLGGIRPEQLLRLQLPAQGCALDATLAFSDPDGAYPATADPHRNPHMLALTPEAVAALLRAAEYALQQDSPRRRLGVSCSGFEYEPAAWPASWIMRLHALGVRELRLESMHLSEEDVRALAQWLPDMEALSLLHCYYPGPSLAPLRALRCARRLRRLTIGMGPAWGSVDTQLAALPDVLPVLCGSVPTLEQVHIRSPAGLPRREEEALGRARSRLAERGLARVDITTSVGPPHVW